MKKMRLLHSAAVILLLLPLSSWSQSGWSSQQSGTQAFLYGMQFTNKSTGWAVGTSNGAGVIVSTVNEGLDWIGRSSPANSCLTGVSFPTSSVGIVIGCDGGIYRSVNGGWNWTTVQSGIPIELDGICFSNASTGFIVGEHGVILRTTDAGADWTSQSIGIKRLLSVSAVDANTIIVVGDSAILRSTDAGLTWNSQYPNPHRKWLSSVQFVDKNFGVAAGGDSVLLTTNAGVSWVVQLVDRYASIISAYFTSRQIGTAVGTGGRIFHTTDGGQKWQQQTSGTTEQLNKVQFTDSLSGFIVGALGTILNTTTAGIVWLEDKSPPQNRTTILGQNFPNPFSVATTIPVQVSSGEHSVLHVLDWLGREVYHYTMSEVDNKILINGEMLPSGIYFYSLSSEPTKVKMMSIVK